MRGGVRWVCVAASLWPVLAGANPFGSLPLLPTGETAVTGKTIVTLEDGDYVHPRFSPDSRYLAFARVVLEGDTELTEIGALDLRTREVRTLLDAKGSRQFAVYKSFVAGFSWKDAATLQATVSDGDVNGVDLVFDVAGGRLLEKKPISLADDASRPDSALLAGFVAAFPAIPPPVLENALINGFKVGDGKYLVQKNYWKQDNHLWYLDAAAKHAVKLVDIPDDWIYSLRGAFAYGNAFILLVAYKSEAYLARSNGGKLELLYRFPVKNYQQTSLTVEHARPDRVLFQVSTGPSYEKRENYLFVYDRAGLRKVKDVSAVYDLDVDGSGRLACFSLWKGNRRVLAIRELKEPR